MTVPPIARLGVPPPAARLLPQAGAAILFWFALLAFGLASLFWSLSAGLLYRILPGGRAARLGQRAIMRGFRGFIAVMEAVGIFRCDLAALDALAADAPLIVASNHPSLLDAVLVISRLPHVVCITKASIWDNWFLGGGARLAGYIRNDAPVDLIRRAVAELRGGHQLLVFPEGTRSDALPVGPFKPGFALMAHRGGAAVQTVFIEGSSRYLGKGWGLFRRPHFPLVYRVRLGRRFDVPADPKGFSAELEAYYREQLGAGTAGLDGH